MIDTKALREKILDLAMRGKLVPQDPNDEPASELLKRIKAEKEELIKQKKIKRDKNETEIFRGDDGIHYEKFADGTVNMVETPYDLPQGWEWVRLRTLITYQNGKAFKSSSYVKQHGFQVIRLGNVKNNKMVLGASPIFISEQDAKESLDYKIFEDDILVTMTGTKGKTDFFYTTKINSFDLEDNELFLNQRVGIIRPISSGVSPDFLNHALKEGEIKKYVFNSATGTANQSNISTVTINNILIPVPPIEEQLKINDLLSDSNQKLDSIDKEQSDIQFLANQLKQKVLDVAMQGKLVPQDPNDEPASVLLEKIRAEKQRLFEEGKIKKKDLVETEIVKGDDNAYYKKLPKGWSITNLQRLTTPITLNDGDWIVSKDMTVAPEIKLIQLGSIGFGKYIDKGFKYITEETFNQLNCTEIHSGYLMVNRLIAEQMYVTTLPRIEGKKITTVDVCWIAPTKYFSLRFMMFQMMGQRFQKQAIQLGTGSTRLRISKGNLIKIPIVLPPIEEQERIVPQIEKYLQLIDKSF